MKRAFSLIELSIAILIIGIIIVGVTQSSRLVKQFRISSARSLTQSSPVAQINGLMLWVEATSEESFIAAQAEDGLPITTWYDINPQTTSKNHATRGTSNTNVVYEDNAINSLPSLYFNGSTTTTSHLAASVINSASNKLTFFVVAKSNEASSSSWRPTMHNGDHPGNTGWNCGKTGETPSVRHFTLNHVGGSRGGAFTANAEVTSGTFDGTNAALYTNGTANTLDDSTPGTMITPTAGGFYIGNYSATTDFPSWLGYISEIIIFDRALKTEERKEIEKYLGKKWGIVVS